MSEVIFSIITVTFNAIDTVEQTILSVLSQDRTLFEYIIIDGGSTDGTSNCISKYSNNLAYWISERDSGIYDAMNKGLDRSIGKWILFLGADDRLNFDILRKIKPYLSDSFDLVYGNVLFNNGKRFNSKFNVKTILNNTVHHQGAFYNRTLFAQFRYDTTIKAMSDYELNLLIYLNRKKRKKVELDISECNINGVSSSLELSLLETNIIRSKHFTLNTGLILSQLLKIKYFLHYDILRKI